MQDAKRAFLVARRVIAIAGSKEYDEDCRMPHAGKRGRRVKR